jgi:hypothetical protein
MQQSVEALQTFHSALKSISRTVIAIEQRWCLHTAGIASLPAPKTIFLYDVEWVQGFGFRPEAFDLSA